MLDADLAALYGVRMKALNQAVARNAKRFPGDFAFPLSAAEVAALKSQSVTSRVGRGGRWRDAASVHRAGRRDALADAATDPDL
jgi:hypothetical protein